MPSELIFGLCFLSFIAIVFSFGLKWCDDIDTFLAPVIFLIIFGVLASWLSISFSNLKQSTYEVQAYTIKYNDGTSEQVIKDCGKIISITKDIGVILPDNAIITVHTSSSYSAGLWWSIHNTYSIAEK